MGKVWGSMGEVWKEYGIPRGTVQVLPFVKHLQCWEKYGMSMGKYGGNMEEVWNPQRYSAVWGKYGEYGIPRGTVQVLPFVKHLQCWKSMGEMWKSMGEVWRKYGEIWEEYGKVWKECGRVWEKYGSVWGQYGRVWGKYGRSMGKGPVWKKYGKSMGNVLKGTCHLSVRKRLPPRQARDRARPPCQRLENLVLKPDFPTEQGIPASGVGNHAFNPGFPTGYHARPAVRPRPRRAGLPRRPPRAARAARGELRLLVPPAGGGARRVAGAVELEVVLGRAPAALGNLDSQP
eukprot:gene10222-biopygen13213